MLLSELLKMMEKEKVELEDTHSSAAVKNTAKYIDKKTEIELTENSSQDKNNIFNNIATDNSKHNKDTELNNETRETNNKDIKSIINLRIFYKHQEQESIINKKFFKEYVFSKLCNKFFVAPLKFKFAFYTNYAEIKDNITHYTYKANKALYDEKILRSIYFNDPNILNLSRLTPCLIKLLDYKINDIMYSSKISVSVFGQEFIIKNDYSSFLSIEPSGGTTDDEVKHNEDDSFKINEENIKNITVTVIHYINKDKDKEINDQCINYGMFLQNISHSMYLNVFDSNNILKAIPISADFAKGLDSEKVYYYIMNTWNIKHTSKSKAPYKIFIIDLRDIIPNNCKYSKIKINNPNIQIDKWRYIVETNNQNPFVELQIFIDGQNINKVRLITEYISTNKDKDIFKELLEELKKPKEHRYVKSVSETSYAKIFVIDNKNYNRFSTGKRKVFYTVSGSIVNYVTNKKYIRLYNRKEGN